MNLIHTFVGQKLNFNMQPSLLILSLIIKFEYHLLYFQSYYQNKISSKLILFKKLDSRYGQKTTITSCIINFFFICGIIFKDVQGCITNFK